MDVPFRDLPREHQDRVILGDPDYGTDEEHEWPRAWYGVKATSAGWNPGPTKCMCGSFSRAIAPTRPARTAAGSAATGKRLLYRLPVGDGLCEPGRNAR